MSAARQRLVVVSNRVPKREATDGFVPRLYQFMQAAAERMDVQWVWVRPPGHEYPADADPPSPPHVLAASRAPWQQATTKGRLLRLVGQYSFDPLPYDCYPRRWPALRETLAELHPDLVVFYLPFLAHLVNHVTPDIPVIAVLEEGWEEVYREWLRGPFLKRRWLAWRERSRYARVYRHVGRRAAAVVAISDAERERFAGSIDRAKIHVLPHGVDLEYFAPGDAPTRDIDVLVLGDLRAVRNYRGAVDTWEAALTSPETRDWTWAFVGRIEEHVASKLRRGGAVITGAVDDVRPYYERARTVLVPAVAGSGVKSTAIQAWAMRRPLVASPIGARGLPARPSQNILIGEDSAALVGHVHELLRNPDRAEAIAEQGRAAAERHCDMALIAQDFASLCSGVADSAKLVRT